MTRTGDSSKATQNASYRASNEIHILLFFLVFYLTAFLHTPAGRFCKDVMLKDSHWNQAQKCLSGEKKKKKSTSTTTHTAECSHLLSTLKINSPIAAAACE